MRVRARRPRRIGHAAREGRARGRRLRAQPRVPRHLEGPGPRAARAPQPRALRGDLGRSADAVLPRRRADRDARRHDRRGRDRGPPRLGRLGRGGGRRGRTGGRARPRARTRALARGTRGLPAARGSPRGPARAHGVPRCPRQERGCDDPSPRAGPPARRAGRPRHRGRDRRRRPRRRRGRARRRSVVAGGREAARRLAPDRLGARVAGPRGARTPAVPPLDPERGAPPAGRPGPRARERARFPQVVDARVR